MKKNYAENIKMDVLNVRKEIKTIRKRYSTRYDKYIVVEEYKTQKNGVTWCESMLQRFNNVGNIGNKLEFTIIYKDGTSFVLDNNGYHGNFKKKNIANILIVGEQYVGVYGSYYIDEYLNVKPTGNDKKQKKEPKKIEIFKNEVPYDSDNFEKEWEQAKPLEEKLDGEVLDSFKEALSEMRTPKRSATEQLIVDKMLEAVSGLTSSFMQFISMLDNKGVMDKKQVEDCIESLSDISVRILDAISKIGDNSIPEDGVDINIRI